MWNSSTGSFFVIKTSIVFVLFFFVFKKVLFESNTQDTVDSVQEILTNFCHLIIKFPVSLLTLCYEFFFCLYFRWLLDKT